MWLRISYLKVCMISLNIICRKSVLFLIFLPALLLGQSRDNSPFSRFGFGDIQDDNFIYSRNMGGLGAAIYNPYEINIVNPASINYLSAAAFDIGFTGDYNSLTDQNGQNASFWAGNLSYISLAFPLKNTLNDLLCLLYTSPSPRDRG